MNFAPRLSSHSYIGFERAANAFEALVRNGDRIRLSVKERRIDLLVAEDELDGAVAEGAVAIRGWRGHRTAL